MNDPSPALASIVATHSLSTPPPTSTPPSSSSLPALVSGIHTFASIDAVLAQVRELHEREDPEVAPHRSKYEARIIMTDIISLLTPLLQSTTFTSSELHWLTEQIGRLSYLNGINHIESEETSSGEKMLSKALLKFKDNGVLLYPYDILDGYNHLGVVWSNRTQHDVSHAYLQIAQQLFLRMKKQRAKEMDALTEEERKRIAQEDKKQQMKETVAEEEAGKKEQEESKEESIAPVATAASSPSSNTSTSFLNSVFWQKLEVTHTFTLFFLAQVYGHLKKRDLAAIYCHLCLNRQLKQRADFQKSEWVTNAIGLSFYYSGRKLFQQAHHCLLAAQHFIKEEDMPKKKNTVNSVTTRDQQLAADLCRAWGAFYLKWLQRSRDKFIEDEILHEIEKSEKEELDEKQKAEKEKEKLVKDEIAAASASSTSVASVDAKDDLGASDPSTSLTSLPLAEQLELKKLQRLDRERERHFENAIEEEADEEEDDLFGDLSKARKMKSKEQLEQEEKDNRGKVIDRTLPSSLTQEEQQAVTEELKKNVEEDTPSASIATPAIATSALASSTTPSTSSAPLFIEFKSLSLPASPACQPARTFSAARDLFKLSFDWFTRATYFYLLDGYVSDHIPIQQDISLLYKLLAVFDTDLSRQCKMHKRRIDLLSPIYVQLSLASYQEFYQQLTDELASTYTDMLELKQFIFNMRVRLLGKKYTEKKRDADQSKMNELALQSIKYYQIWLQSWSKDGKEVEKLDEYYHRWYLMAMFKIARCYSKIYHSDAQVMNQFLKKSLDAYRAVIQKALAWDAVGCMPEELSLCKDMIELLPHKMDRVSAKGGFRV